MSDGASALWFVVFFIALWLLVGGLLTEASRWPALARAYPDRTTARGQRLFGQVTAVGGVNENRVTALDITDLGLRMTAMFLFRFRRPPLLVPWDQVRGVGPRRFLWARWYVLDLGGITTVGVKTLAWDAIRPHLTGASRGPGESGIREAPGREP